MLIAMSILASTIVATQVLAETLILQGSTTFARRLMEPHKAAIETDSKHELTLIPNKSMPGLIALMEGRAHMAMISAPLTSEIEALQRIMPGLAYDRLQAHQILNTRVAFALHPSNRVRKASLNQIRKILLGEITNWAALGGADLPIRVVMVGGGGGVTTVIESRVAQRSTRSRSACHLRENARATHPSHRAGARRDWICPTRPDQTTGSPRTRHRTANRADAESRHPRRPDAGHGRGHPGGSSRRREGHVARDFRYE